MTISVVMRRTVSARHRLRPCLRLLPQPRLLLYTPSLLLSPPPQMPVGLKPVLSISQSRMKLRAVPFTATYFVCSLSSLFVELCCYSVCVATRGMPRSTSNQSKRPASSKTPHTAQLPPNSITILLANI